MQTLRSILNVLSLSCDESSRLTSDAYERELGRLERYALRVHRLNCRWCRRMSQQFTLLHTLNRRMHRSPGCGCCAAMSAQARQRLLDRLAD